MANVSDKIAAGAGFKLFTTSTNLDLSAESGNCRVFADSSGGPLSVTLPTGAANQVIEVIDAGDSAGTNIITIVGTIDGATNVTIEANGGTREITYSGSAWESSGGFNQFFERDAATSTIKAKNPDTLQSDVLAAGDSGTSYSEVASNFTDPEANVSQDAAGWGNDGTLTELAVGDFASTTPANVADGTTGSATAIMSGGIGATGTIVYNLNASTVVKAIGLYHNDAGLPDRINQIRGRNSSGAWTVISSADLDVTQTVNVYNIVAFENSTAYDEYEFTLELTEFGVNGTGYVRDTRLYEIGSYESTLNTFVHRAFTSQGATNVDLATLAPVDETSTPLADGEVLVEYSTDNGVGWSTQLGLTSTKALGIISGATSFWLRYEMVGANRMKSSLVQSTATYTRAVSGGTETYVDSVLAHKVTGDGTLFKNFTTAERDAISTPATGLTIFNSTTNAHNVYNGTSWVELGGGATSEQIANLEYNIGVNSLRDAVNGGFTYFNMLGGVGDVYTDETGIDTGSSVDAAYNAAGDYYEPTPAFAGDLLLQSDTTDGSATFTDLSTNNETITVNGNTQHDTAQAKFGASSIIFDQVGDSLDVAGASSWDLSGDFTVHLWVRSSVNENVDIVNKPNSFYLVKATNGRFDLKYYHSSGTLVTLSSAASLFSLDTWHHLAVVVNGTNIRLYRDGTAIIDATLAGTMDNSALAFRIGDLGTGSSHDTNMNLWEGWMDEIVVDTTQALWTADFTSPTTPTSTESKSMTLPSIDFTTNIASVDYVRPVVLWEPIDASTLNTDFILEVSRDSGTTWTAATLETDAVFTGSVVILVADEVDITGQPSGTTATYRIRTLNSKEIRVHGVYLQWR